MSNDNKVLIRYVDHRLINQHSAKVVEISKELADKYVERGWCKILSTFPDANPDLTDIEVDELKKKYESNSVKCNMENLWLTSVAWVTSGQIPLSYRKYGDACGFIISQVSPINFSPGKVCLNDLIILSNDLGGFNDIQILKLGTVLFQRSIPFVLRIENHLLNDERTKHYLLRAEVVFCSQEDYVAEALELLGEGVEDRLFIESTEQEFWKRINEVGIRECKGISKILPK
jgi:hypothetical protein